MKCKQKTKGGLPCKMPAIAGGKYCFTHDPQSAGDRAKAHKAGGLRQRADHAGDPEKVPTSARTLAEAMQILDYTLAEAIPLENSIQRGRLLIALVAGYISAIQVGELEARLIALENTLSVRP